MSGDSSSVARQGVEIIESEYAVIPWEGGWLDYEPGVVIPSNAHGRGMSPKAGL